MMIKMMANVTCGWGSCAVIAAKRFRLRWPDGPVAELDVCELHIDDVRNDARNGAFAVESEATWDVPEWRKGTDG